ncbi:MAG: MMPL family transporter [Myxococcota bacterium]|nr:MMPL family transporter [Myxococcota bacterium]
MNSRDSRPPDSPNPWFLRMGWSFVRHRLAYALLLAMITAGAMWLVINKLEINNSLEVFAPDSPEMDAIDEYRATFGRDDLFLILIEGDVFTPAFLQRLKQAHEIVANVHVDVEISSHLDAVPTKPSRPQSADAPPIEDDFGDDFADGFEDDFEDPTSQQGDDWEGVEGGSVIEDVVSLINARQTVPITIDGESGIRVEKLLDPMPPEDALPNIKKAALNDPAIVGRLVGKSARHTVIAARTFQMRDEDMELVALELQRALEPLQADFFKIQVTGQPAINAALNQIVLQDTARLATYSGLAMLLMLTFLFRHPIGIFGPVVVVGLAVVWTLGFMAAVGYGMTILSVILPSFLLVVGVGDSVHMISIYRDLRRFDVPNNEAIARAVGVTGPPVLFTSLTTMCGLFSLNFANIEAIAEMGVAGGVGVMFALTLSLIFLPICLTFNRSSLMGAAPRNASDSGDLIDRAIGVCVRLSLRTGLWEMVAVFAIFSTIAIYGITTLKVSHDDLATIPDDMEIKRSVFSMDKYVGGVSSAVLILEPKSGTMKDLNVLQGLEKLAEDIQQFELEGVQVVGHALSLLDVVKETRRALNNGDPKAYRLPDTQDELNALLFLFETSGPSELRRLATLNLDKSHITFQVKWREATSYKPLLERIETSAEKHLSATTEVRGTGSVYLMFRIVLTLLQDLIKSFGTAFLFITVLMVFMLRDLKLGLIAMVPNLVPIAIVMGMMGLTNIPVDLNNLLIASIALGIAVDDTIHFLHHFKAGLIETGDCERAITTAAHHAARAMVGTSIILGAGFLVYVAALNAAIARFGVLIGLTVIAALVVDLILLPAILRITYGHHTARSSHPA